MDTMLATACALLCLALSILAAWAFRPSHSLPLPPGPRGWPLVGAFPLLGRMPHVALAELAKRYGPIMYLKMGTCGTLVASTPDAARLFFRDKDVEFSNRPEVVVSTIATYNRRDIVWADYSPRWALLRKLLHVHMLGNMAFGEWSATRRSEVGRLLESLLVASNEGKPVRLLEKVIGTYMNMIGLFALRRRVFDELGGPESREFRDVLDEIMAIAGRFNISDFLPSIGWMDLQGIRREAMRIYERHDRFVTKMLKEHKASAHQREGDPDFLDTIMANVDSPHEEERLHIKDVKALYSELFLTASDPCSVSIEWAMAEMHNNPSIFKRAQSEMDQVVGKSRRLEESDIPKLPYLQAIVKETLRKHPPLPLCLPHFSDQECEVNGYHIPKNTRLHVNVWAISRDPNVWEEPLEFRPERFLSGKGREIEPYGNNFEMIPFGSGRRMCPSQQSGTMLVQYVLGTMVHAFDWRLPEGLGINLEEEPGLSLRMAQRLWSMPSPRLEACVYCTSDAPELPSSHHK